MRQKNRSIMVRVLSGLIVVLTVSGVNVALAAAPRALSLTAQEVNDVYTKAQAKKCKEAKLVRKITADLKTKMDFLQERENYIFRAEPIYSMEVQDFGSRIQTLINALNSDADQDGRPDSGTLFSSAITLKMSILSIETLANSHPQVFALPDDITMIGPPEQAMLDALKELKRIMPGFRSSIHRCRAFEPNGIYFPATGPMAVDRVFAWQYQESLFSLTDIIMASLDNVLPEAETPVSMSLHSDLYRMWQVTRHLTSQVEDLAMRGLIAVRFSTNLLDDMREIQTNLDDERHDLPKKGEDLAKEAQHFGPTIDNYCIVKPADLYSCTDGNCRLDNKNRDFNLKALIENKRPR